MNLEELKNYIAIHKWDQQSAKATFFVIDHVFSGYNDSVLIQEADISPFLAFFKEKMFYQFIVDDKVSALGKALYRNFLANQNSLDALINKHLVLTEELDLMWKKVQSLELALLSNSQLAEVVEEYVSLSHAWWSYPLLLEDKGRVIEEEIVPKFAKRHTMTLSKAQEMFSQLSHPSELFVFNRERLAFLGLCQWVYAQYNEQFTQEQLLQDQKFNEQFQDYLREFFWCDSDFYKYQPITVENICQKIKSTLTEKGIEQINQEINSIVESVKTIEDNKRDLFHQLSLSKEEQSDVYFARRIIEWLEYRKVGIMKDLYYVSCLMDICAERLHLTFDEIGLLRANEILQMLRGGAVFDKTFFKRREAGTMAVFFKKRPIELYYDSISSELFSALQRGFQSSQLIKGTVASRAGMAEVSGRVNIVLDPERDTFEDGSILVTSMTRIEFVPLMSKAKAIVTNEGGIACHAAIVSRELGIPCIIGTKNATKALKTGDTVTLDLTTGHISIKV